MMAANLRPVPEFMRQAVNNLQIEIALTQAQTRFSWESYLSSNLTLLVLGLLALAFIVILVLIFSERQKSLGFRDKIRQNDLRLIQTALQDFFKIHGLYPSSQESKEFDQTLAKAALLKKPLKEDGKESHLLKLLKKILGENRYQKVLAKTFDSSEIRDPKQGEKVPGTDKVFGYYYSTGGLSIHELTHPQKSFYRVWCYLEKGPSNSEGLSVYEITAA